MAAASSSRWWCCPGWCPHNHNCAGVEVSGNRLSRDAALVRSRSAVPSGRRNQGSRPLCTRRLRAGRRANPPRQGDLRQGYAVRRGVKSRHLRGGLQDERPEQTRSWIRGRGEKRRQRSVQALPAGRLNSIRKNAGSGGRRFSINPINSRMNSIKKARILPFRRIFPALPSANSSPHFQIKTSR